MREDPDLDLVRRHLGGDPRAFAALMERHQRRVYTVAYRMLGRREEAADATQEVFLTCLRKLPGFRAESAFSTWLHRVTVNVCHDALRRRSRERPADQPPDLSVADRGDDVALSVDVQRALLQVPEDFRVALILHDVEDMAYEDIAEALGAPVGTVKSRVHRGRVALARALGHPGASREPAGPSHPSNPQEARE